MTSSKIARRNINLNGAKCESDNDTPEVPNLWTLREVQRYPGRVRNGEGKPLSGFAVKESKKRCTVSILSNGYYTRHYRFPKNVTAPKHPMIRWMNVPMCGGMSLCDAAGNSLSSDDAIANAVFAGKKPVGDLLFKHEEVARKSALVVQAIGASLEVFEYTRPHNAESFSFVMMGVNTPLAELFDLEMVCRFYREGTGEAERYFREYMDRVARLTPVQALQTYDWASPRDAREIMLTGLCLGYAFESTLGIMLEI